MRTLSIPRSLLAGLPLAAIAAPAGGDQAGFGSMSTVSLRTDHDSRLEMVRVELEPRPHNDTSFDVGLIELDDDGRLSDASPERAGPAPTRNPWPDAPTGSRVWLRPEAYQLRRWTSWPRRRRSNAFHRYANRREILET